MRNIICNGDSAADAKIVVTRNTVKLVHWQVPRGPSVTYQIGAAQISSQIMECRLEYLVDVQ